MNRRGGAWRPAPIVLAGLCVVIACLGATRVGVRVAGARADTLARAERAIESATAPFLRRPRMPRQIATSVALVLAHRELALNYITVRDAQDKVLVSRGRFTTRLAWLPADLARSWRGWLYRVRSAEAKKAVSRHGKRIGYFYYGVDWSGVFARSGARCLAWLCVAVFGLVGFGFALKRVFAGPGEPRPGDATGPPAAAGPRPAPAAPAVSGFDRPPPGDPAPPAVPAANSAPPHAQTGQATATPARAGHAPNKAGPVQPVAEPRPPESVPHARRGQSPAAAAAGGVGWAAPAARESAQAAPGAADKTAIAQAPRDHAAIDAALDDTTLILRLRPIWRDLAAGVLGAAYVEPAWRDDGDRPVPMATLAEHADDRGCLREFTAWLVRRVATMQANWRGLELAPLPIALTVPPALLAFSDAAPLWRGALAATEDGCHDLIVCTAVSTPALALRRGYCIARPDAAIPADCDLACLRPAAGQANPRDWLALARGADCPLMLGPIDDPKPWAPIIAGDRVCWFSAAAAHRHTQTSFARLLARTAVAPI